MFEIAKCRVDISCLFHSCNSADLLWEFVGAECFKKQKIVVRPLWPSDTTCRHRFGSTLAQEMVCCLTAPSHYVDLSSKVFCGIHFRAVSQEVLRNLIRNTYSKVTLLELLPHLTGPNELIFLVFPPSSWQFSSIMTEFVGVTDG